MEGERVQSYGSPSSALGGVSRAARNYLLRLRGVIRCWENVGKWLEVSFLKKGKIRKTAVF